MTTKLLKTGEAEKNCPYFSGTLDIEQSEWVLCEHKRSAGAAAQHPPWFARAA